MERYQFTGTCYTGVGARQTPTDVLALMREAAAALGGKGLTLRSGGAEGADSAFQEGSAGTPSQIFVPWHGFACRLTIGAEVMCVTESEHYPSALMLAQKFHPNWARCTSAARKLHARNVFQILGPDLQSPSSFLLCWTKNGKDSGGTGQAIRIAEGHGVPVYNLQHPQTLLAVQAALGGSHGA